MDNLLTTTQFTGKFLVHLPRVDSTNNYAKEYMSKTSPKDGAVILADEQYAGRGQSGNSWESDPLKNLTFSIIYRTDFLPASDQFYLNMAISLGLAEAIQASLTKEDTISVKWPNDLYVRDRKIAGILIENIVSGANLSWSIIGIGLNINQEIFSDDVWATSLFLENRVEADRFNVLKNILERVEFYYLELRSGNLERLKKNYLDVLYHFNEWHSFSDQAGKFEGKITGVNTYGNLIVETATGIREYGMKEIKFERPAN